MTGGSWSRWTSRSLLLFTLQSFGCLSDLSFVTGIRDGTFFGGLSAARALGHFGRFYLAAFFLSCRLLALFLERRELERGLGRGGVGGHVPDGVG